MSWKKRMLMAAIVVLLFGAVAGGLVWHNAHYTMVDLNFYPKNAAVLDLRGQEVSVSHYDKIRRRMPGVEVRWDVPLSWGLCADDTRNLTVASLTEADVKHLDYLTELETVDARGCRDYAALMALMERRPEVEVSYTVALGGEEYGQGVTRLAVENMAQEDISLLQYLPSLETVICGGGDGAVLALVQEYCHSNGLDFGIHVGGRAVLDTETSVTLEQPGEGELALLGLLTQVESIRLENPQVSAGSLLALREKYPQADISWELEAFGEIHSTLDEEIDLSGQVVDSLEEVEAVMAYFPDVRKVFLGQQNLDNEALAAYRDRVRDRYQVVWVVQLGEKLTARTDDTTFMPTREKVFYFHDEEAYNLRYCENMVCIDIGHMSISDISFVEFMPDLEYLVLAHTQVKYIEPIRSCKKLTFLELDWTPIKDYAPLLDCTALEDLNLGNTFADFTPIGEMTWLKNLWMIEGSARAAYQASQALPDTRVVASGAVTVGSGWRKLPNYYAMRDALGMYYMD